MRGMPARINHKTSPEKNSDVKALTIPNSAVVNGEKKTKHAKNQKMIKLP